MKESKLKLKMLPKIVVVLGPTASGKTGLGVALARKFNGEIVSADSRQVYKGMDIGTGKDLKEYGKIPYHLIDVAGPKTRFDLAKYQKLAFKAIDEILEQGRLPIVVGGTGLYLQAIVDNYDLSGVKTDLVLRKKLEKLNINELFARIGELNKKLADKINDSDKKNKRRLIRYLEILEGKDSFEGRKEKKKYNVLLLGVKKEKKEQEKRIYKRLIERLEKEDMIGEVKRLRKEGVSWRRLESFGLEYKFISWHLQDRIDYDEMVGKLFIAIRQFAKRQLVWFRRWERQGAEIMWVKDKNGAEKTIMQFIKKKD